MREKTHFADDETLAHIARLEAENAELRIGMDVAKNMLAREQECAEKAEAELRRYREAKLPEETLWLTILREHLQGCSEPEVGAIHRSNLAGLVGEIDKLRAFAAAQTVRAESNERDARRYRWLRDYRSIIDFDLWPGGYREINYFPDNLDSAIDAAMKEEGK